MSGDTRTGPEALPVADLIEWAKTCRYFLPEDFAKLAQLAAELERAREYARGLGGWFDDDIARREWEAQWGDEGIGGSRDL